MILIPVQELSGICNTSLLVIAAAVLCSYIAPSAGIPEVKAYLNGVDAQSLLAPSTPLYKGEFQR